MTEKCFTRQLNRDDVIRGLVQLREAWREAADGIPLVDVQTSVGLFLLDVANMIGLLPEEAALVVGEDTYTESPQLAFLELAEA